MKRIAFLLLSLCCTALLLSCISIPAKSGLPSASKNGTPPPAPSAVLPPYRLQVGDVIDIKFASNPELDEHVAVRQDGMISTTYVDDTLAYGLTVKELKEVLKEKYADVLKDTKYMGVIIRSSAPSRVYVAGEVNSPGEFISSGPNLTLLQAIARAGGLKNSAQPDNLIIIRRGDGETQEVYSANYKAAASGEDPKSDVRLASYDVVYVPRSGVGDVYLYFQQYVQQFVPFGFSYALSPQTSVFSR